MLIGVAFWISLALSGLKLLEILVSQERQRKVEGWLESITLRLSYVDLSTVYADLRKLKVQLGLGVVTLLLANTAFGIGLMMMGLQFRQILLVFAGNVRFFLVQIPLALILFPLVMMWLVRSERNSSFVKKVCLVYAVALAVLVVGVLSGHDIFLSGYPKIRPFVILPFTIPVSVCFYASVYVTAIKAAQVLVWLITKILWRIIEYPKGAWTGLLFLVTGVLGLGEVFLRAKN